jgi:hypothetical protein
LLAAFALLAGCSSLQPCDHRDLHERHALACMLVGMREEPERDDRGCLLGSVVAEATDASIVVFVYKPDDDGVHVIGSSVLHRPGQYAFAVPPGAYRVAAFEDGDGDLEYDSTQERAVRYHGGETVVVMPGQRIDRLYLKLRDAQAERLEFAVSVPHGGRAASEADAACSTVQTAT